MNFSVLISVYKNDNSKYFKEALDSILNQSIVPSQVVLVVDGPVSENINVVINEFSNNEKFTIVRLEKNVGLGNALIEGLKYCKYELVARADSDDINLNNRFEIQLKEFENDSDLVVLGGVVAEFNGDFPEKINAYRRLPQSDSEIKQFLKSRCPFNHPTIMFKKSAVINAGGYIECKYHEDYFLWVRMSLLPGKFKNFDDVLVYMRVDENTYLRRGGYKYFKHQQVLFKFMLKNKIISYFKYIKNSIVRFVLHVLMPKKMRKWFFCNFLRKKNNSII